MKFKRQGAINAISRSAMQVKQGFMTLDEFEADVAEILKGLIDIKTYIFHWRDGTKTESEGATPEEAFTNAGYGAGAVGALDYHEEKKQ